jgi:hypothetical protein
MVSFPLEDQRLSVYEALRTYTYNSAFATFEENERGTLKVGKIADFAVLDKNPFEVNPEDIQTIKVIETYINGKRFKPLKSPWGLLLKAFAAGRSKV